MMCLLSLSALASDQDELNRLTNLTQIQYCPVKVVVMGDMVEVNVWQHQFRDGTFDLVIGKVEQGKVVGIARLSFKGSKEPKCHFSKIAVRKGGDWGWHVAWFSTEKSAVYYVRVDKEAWVTSPPKKLHDGVVSSLSFSEFGTQLSLTLGIDHQIPPVSTLTSEDEGRSWQ